MALPTVNDIQAVDPVLTGLLLGYMQADTRFVASRVFPVINVEKDSGTYYIFDKKYWFQDEMVKRAPGSNFARAGFGVSTSTYATLQWGLEHPIPYEVEANNQTPMSLQEAGLRWLATQSLIRKERQFASDWMLYSAWSNYDNNSATDWDDFSAGDPVSNVLTAQKTVSDSTAQNPNTMVLGVIVHNALVNHPDVIDRIKYTTAATIGNIESALASLFGIQNYLVARASYSSTREYTTMTAAAIIDDDCLICYTSPTPQMLVASAGYTFAWAGGGGVGMVGSYDDRASRSTILQHVEQWDQKAVATDVGYFFADIV